MHRAGLHRHTMSTLALLLSLGCNTATPPTGSAPAQPRPEAAAEFDPLTAGTIQGQVRWDGSVPSVDSFEVLPNPLGGGAFQKKQVRPNPNAPQIDTPTNGVGNAVVFLRGLAPRRGRRWDLPPVRVEQRDEQFQLRQGEWVSPFGFVPQGGRLEMVSRDPHFHALHASGAAFFSLTFPDPDRPLERVLNRNGLVELTSAAGCFWMRAYVFVDEHPYYRRTDRQGRFVLSQVPPGQYELVCWMPNWRKARHERDPESGFITRLYFLPPVQRVQPVTVGSKEIKEVAFTLSAELFRPEAAGPDPASVSVPSPR